MSVDNDHRFRLLARVAGVGRGGEQFAQATGRSFTAAGSAFGLLAVRGVAGFFLAINVNLLRMALGPILGPHRFMVSVSCQ